ncbi:MAG: hypothetical protein MI864_17070, partial [Pseudomonadales bacterium]|nr:hypothetical protein [Pseudomonadales bacterium]
MLIKTQIRTLFIFIVSLGFCPGAFAIKAEGSFQSVKACAAYKSFKKGHNPGDVYTIPGRDYEVLEINKVDGSWILLDIEEAVPSRRWVALECGVPNILVTGSTKSDSEVSNTGSCQTPNTYDSHVLALSWQAGFCEHYNYSGRKEECDSLNSGNIVITNITIH